jgi:hypothetical protein
MTILSDALARAITYDITGDIDPSARRLHRELTERLGELPYQNATLDAVAEVQDITSGDRDGGTMDLDFTLADGQTFSANGLAWNAAATAVQTAVDAAAVLAVTNYVAGDIVVTGGAFGAAGSDTTFTFSGSSVRGNHPLISVDGASLTGGSVDPVPSEDTAGVVPRFWFAALKALGVIEGTDPAFSATPAGQYTVNTRDELENYPSNSTIRMLIKEATIQEGEDWESELLPLLGLDRVAPGVVY